MRKKDRKTPKYEHSPSSGREIRSTENAEKWKTDRIVFCFSSFDSYGPWGWDAFKGYDWKDFFKKIESYQTMTWNEYYQQGSRNHDIKADAFSPSARKRWSDLEIDTDTVVSFHIKGAIRVYGIRNGFQCHICWFDPWHGDIDKAVCPSTLKHT